MAYNYDKKINVFRRKMQLIGYQTAVSDFGFLKFKIQGNYHSHFPQKILQKYRKKIRTYVKKHFTNNICTTFYDIVIKKRWVLTC